MPLRSRNQPEVDDPAHLSSGQAQGGNSFLNRGSDAWKWLIGYNDTEANRIGVPIVSSKDWLKNIFGNPTSKVSLDGAAESP